MIKKGIVFVLIASLFISCSVLQQLGKQTTEALNIRNCSFNLHSVDNVNIGGVDVKNLKSLSLGNIATLSACMLAKKLPITMGVNVGASNPSDKDASISKMLWQCTIDDISLAEGTTTGSYKIPAQGSTVIPISVTADAYQIFSSTGLEAVKSFIGTFTNNSTTSSRLAVKVKPTIEMGASTVTLPFISLASN
ncbi:MAG: hypothetical protein J5792_01170 [Bacteroidales bacterium]|nr:hypothetical protein [Bacteroidales bacterium]